MTDDASGRAGLHEKTVPGHDVHVAANSEVVPLAGENGVACRSLGLSVRRLLTTESGSRLMNAGSASASLKILSAIIYLNDVTQKKELNRAWDEWVDAKNPPMRACVGVDIEAPHVVEIVVTAAK